MAMAMATPTTTDLFLTHNWGEDSHKRDNHSRVSQVNEALKLRGYVTWFDNDRMVGNIPTQMASGIQNTKVVLTFITKRYEEKVTGDNANDNCRLEFEFAAQKKSKDRMIAVVMETQMKDSSSWNGTLGLYLGNTLYVDMSGDLDNARYFQAQLGILCAIIESIIPRGVDELTEFLHSLNLGEYYDSFIKTGNDDIREMSTLPESEMRKILQEEVKVKSGHARKFVNALKRRNVPVQLPQDVAVTVTYPKCVEDYRRLSSRLEKHKYVKKLLADKNFVDFQQLMVHHGHEVAELRDENNGTILMEAAYLDLVQYGEVLLKWGADPQATLDGGFTILHFASAGGSDEFVRWLLQQKHNPLRTDEYRQNSLDTAKIFNKDSTLKILQQHLELNNIQDTGKFAGMSIDEVQKDRSVIEFLRRLGLQ